MGLFQSWGPRRLWGCGVALLCMVSGSAGHKSLVCSSTSPSDPGRFVFWICTYHPNPTTAHNYPCTADGCVPRCPEVPGATGPCCLPPPPAGRVCGHLTIHEHDRDRESDAGTWCTLQNQVGGTTPSNPDEIDMADPGLYGDNLTVAVLEANMKRGTPGSCITRAQLSVDNVTVVPLVRPDSAFSCYHHNAANNPEFWGAAVIGNSAGLQPAGDTAVEHIVCTGSRGAVAGTWAAYQRPIKTCYAVLVDDPGLKAGSFYAFTEGTDENLEPSDKLQGRTPCGMQQTEPYYFDISIADNGTACTTQPFQDPHAVPQSIVECDGSVVPRFSGFLCSVVCPRPYRRLGNLQCANGIWTPYECTTEPTCAAPSAFNNVSIPGGNGSMYISQVFDGDPGPGTVPPSPGCGAQTKAGTYCNYTCNTDPDPYCSPSRGTPRQTYPVGYRAVAEVRSTIVCGRDGLWYPGPGFCGCRESPCQTPTPTRTETPTKSASWTPSMSSSKSPTISRTFFSPTPTPTTSPTSTQTPYPFCLFGTGWQSTPCVDRDTLVWLPWLLFLLLPLMCCLLAICALCCRTGPQPAGVRLAYLPAADDILDIAVTVTKPELRVPPPPQPRELEPVVPDVRVVVSPVPPEDVEVNVHAIHDGAVSIGVHPDTNASEWSPAGPYRRAGSFPLPAQSPSPPHVGAHSFAGGLVARPATTSGVSR
eukprot:TRINITY_DN3647_c0_g1_i2.p1 TRINITY_DN3647_c0_g1~~TRINITY_DN3647_c0_g1_i2.p1  ORF type:complete len:701 (+),score=109.51 TRINITY_DN3647_c0_g1_i2:53-2155(+)